MTISLSEYLLNRLKELNIKHIFGVPGDYNLVFLDQIINNPSLEWVGVCNELNGAYAADGYARIRGASALVTTFGVGELSAVNGIAGAYAEYSPVVNIVGYPSTTAQKNKLIAHHTLGDGRFDLFVDIFKNITCMQVLLSMDNNPTEKIDQLLRACWLYKRPVYIGIPSDLVFAQVEEPTAPLDLSYPASNPEAVSEAVERIVDLIKQAKSPVILADICADRHPMKSLIQKLLNNTKIPFATMNLGKGLIDESHPQYQGLYCGALSSQGVREIVENSDCLITFGTLLSDFNTGGFSIKFNVNTLIEIHSNYTKVKQSIYQNVFFCDLIPALIKKLSTYHCPQLIEKKSPVIKNNISDTSNLTQDLFWSRVVNCLSKDCIVLAETGSSLFGSIDMLLPDGAKFIGQVLWASIGFALPATLGAKIAAPERQTILFIGDGSFQLTAQEVSTMMRHQLNPIIFLINNEGYTIERLIHGKEAIYNNIATWNYAMFPKVFAGPVKSIQVRNNSELEDVISQIQSGTLNKNQLAFIEVFLPKLDAPKSLFEVGKFMEEKNKG